MAAELREKDVAKVVGIQSQPELNGGFVRLGKQKDNGRWETYGFHDPTQEKALKATNLEPLPPVSRQLFYYLDLARPTVLLDHMEAHSDELPANRMSPPVALAPAAHDTANEASM